MRRLLLTGVGLVLVLYLLPVFYPSETDKTEPQAPTESVTAAATDGLTITVLVNGKAQEMPLETYVEGVTAAEIADDFPVEAIRAQAVAARTYAVYKQSRGRPAEHPDADVCDDYSHCAAYQPDAVKTFSTGYSRIRKAVKDTAGQILTCDGAPIAAVFHCVSGPKTESAADVWGEDIPYLQSVVSPGGTQYAGYESEVDANGGCVPRKGRADSAKSGCERYARPLVCVLGALGGWRCENREARRRDRRGNRSAGAVRPAVHEFHHHNHRGQYYVSHHRIRTRCWSVAVRCEIYGGAGI